MEKRASRTRWRSRLPRGGTIVEGAAATFTTIQSRLTQVTGSIDRTLFVLADGGSVTPTAAVTREFFASVINRVEAANELAGIAGSTKVPTYLSVSEEAMRQQHPDIVTLGSNFAEAPAIITGKPSTETPARDTSFDTVRAAAEGHPSAAVTIATPNAAEQQPPDVDPSKRIVQGHAYSVQGFDDQGRIILRNPWCPEGGTGSDGTYSPGEVRLTEDEYRRWLGGVGVLPQPYGPGILTAPALRNSPLFGLVGARLPGPRVTPTARRS